MENIKEKENSVYEVSYLIVSSIPEEKIPAEGEALKKIITDAGSTIITDEAPHRQPLAYTMRRKMVSGGYEKFDVAYFGWVKFEVGSNKIEAIKKAVELHPSVLRALVITTVAENTYLGKRASDLVAALAPLEGLKAEEKTEAAPATIEDMDKSIENMVKEV
ncbi:MAG: 30S ribosomal protein S6 [bacterium]|nr:30S ribosomal protein S6 [bacterium]